MKAIVFAGLLGAALVGTGGHLFVSADDAPVKTGSIKAAAPAPAPLLAADPRTALNVVKVDWKREGFGLTAAVDVSVRNNNSYTVRVDRVSCRFKNSSGETQDYAQGVYDIIQPRTEKLIRNVALGFVSEQDKGIGCSIIGARKEF